eukprot:GHVT01087772.1.p1 GENE.GHVT01087772.1~~GHVT01087772.1.p1  ORF type:complete len:119 (-),score=4.18 GHVT01087772.1:1418-1774(-)
MSQAKTTFRDKNCTPWHSPRSPTNSSNKMGLHQSINVGPAYVLYPSMHALYKPWDSWTRAFKANVTHVAWQQYVNATYHYQKKSRQESTSLTSGQIHPSQIDGGDLRIPVLRPETHGT